MSKTKISNEVIENFLQGSDPQKYIVAIEASYNTNSVTLVINDPEYGKRLETHKFNSFLWFKEDIVQHLYEGKRMKRLEAGKKFGIKISALKTDNEDGFSPERLYNGYKYMAKCSKTYNDLVNFFKYGGVDVFSKEFSKSFVMFSPTEQFLIQSGKRLFKGMDDYNDVHRFQFDLETEGLFASKNAIFQIGVRDNKGMERVLETLGNDGYERRDSERENIKEFFIIIDEVKPDIIAGYNSENFDWPYLFERADRLNIPITDLAITLNRLSKIKRKPSTIKFGGETENYLQTNMYGYNIIDISHAVRRAMAINSEIKSWGLKYITQYSDIAKPNRVYVPGDKINTTWADKVNNYAFNDADGDWYMITDTKPLKEGYTIKKGDYIVQRYLCDDLWETEQIDNIFNQASFLIAKILPTSFQRSSTMGTAGQWKLIMAAWSYENKLAIPETQTKRDFTGGLSRLLEVGYARNVVKLDYAALYPKIQITHGIFPELDISGVMEGMLTYVVDTRDNFKFLTGTEKGKAKKLEKELEKNKDSLSTSEIEAIKKQISEHKALSNIYDKKQLPLKILANSWFGSYGAPYIFNWGDSDSAEETTCRGRQYLRLMVKHFTEKHGFRALVGDTDGFNFSFPDNIDEIKYLAKGSHWKTSDDGGKELIGLDAVLAEFNETFMEGRMGLDIDDICNSTINFARKNYANDIGGKIKLVGNSVKSKKMSVYIEDFLGKGIRMLLDGDGYSFVNYYYEYVDKIYNYQIPLVKIASKARVKISMDEYKKKATLKNKAGNPMPKQAHMELALKDNIETKLGDTLYYVNTGSAKSHGDLKTEKNKETGLTKITLNCNLIDPDTVERDFELIKELEILKKSLSVIDKDDQDSINSIEQRINDIENSLATDEYNVARYLDNFNKKVKPLLVCFNLDVRNNILLDIVKVKDKTTKKVTEKLKERMFFTQAECELISGIPNKEIDQDSYEELMKMEDKEIKFWDKVNKVPNNMEESEWNEIRADYHIRMAKLKEDGVKHEKEMLDNIFKHLEMEELTDILDNGVIPIEIIKISDFSKDGSNMLVSRKWGEELYHINDIFKYSNEAKDRNKYYKMVGIEDIDKNENRYEQWLDYLTECNVMTGTTYDGTTIEEDSIEHESENVIEKLNIVTEKIIKNTESTIIETAKDVKSKKKITDDEDAEDEIELDVNGNIIRTDDTIKLDDEYDDTFAEIPDNYDDEIIIVNEVEEVIIPEKVEIKKEEPEDEWGF